MTSPCVQGLSATWAADTLHRYMTAPSQQWQPSDLLPDSTSSSSVLLGQLRELRQEAQQLPTDVLVVLVSWGAEGFRASKLAHCWLLVVLFCLCVL